MKTYQSSSSAETKKLGEVMALNILRHNPKQKGATVVALDGELGSGKTTFVQGFFRGAGIKKNVSSPTFILIRRSAIRHKRFSNIFHVDLYRIKKSTELSALGLQEILAEAKNIVLIEWADRVRKMLPSDATWLFFKHCRPENERKIAYSDIIK